MPIYPMRKPVLPPLSSHCDYEMQVAGPPYRGASGGISSIRWIHPNYEKPLTSANLGPSGYRPGLYLQTVTRGLGLGSAVGCRERPPAALLLPGHGYDQLVPHHHQHQQLLAVPGCRRDPHLSTGMRTMQRSSNGPPRGYDRPSLPPAEGQKKGFTIDAILGHAGDIEGGQERLQMASCGDLQVTSRGDLQMNSCGDPQMTCRGDLQMTSRAPATGESCAKEDQGSIPPSEVQMRSSTDPTNSSLAHVSPANDSSSSSSSSSSSFSSSSPPSAAGHIVHSASLRPLTLFAERHERRRSNGGSAAADGRFLTGGWKQNRGKRIRTIFTTEQLQRLEEQFEQQQYMVGTERYYLAMSLQLTEAQVKVWFQNRRIKWRKQSHERQYAKMAGVDIYAEDDDVDDDDEEADDNVSEDSSHVDVNDDVTMMNLHQPMMAECLDHVSDMADCRNLQHNENDSF